MKLEFKQEENWKNAQVVKLKQYILEKPMSHRKCEKENQKIYQNK